MRALNGAFQSPELLAETERPARRTLVDKTSEHSGVHGFQTASFSLRLIVLPTTGGP